MKRPASHPPHGQSLVEFALVLPILLLLSIMLLDLGRAVYYSSAIHNAAREGVRYGSVNNEEDTGWPGMILAARNKAIGINLTDITADWGPDEPNCTHTVKITIRYNFTPGTPLVASFLPGGVISLVGDATMRTEYDKSGIHECDWTP